jgi:hypothetical protein
VEPGLAEVKAKDYWSAFVYSLARPLRVDPGATYDEVTRLDLDYVRDDVDLERVRLTVTLAAMREAQTAEWGVQKPYDEDAATPYEGVVGYEAAPRVYWEAWVEEKNLEDYGRFASWRRFGAYSNGPREFLDATLEAMRAGRGGPRRAWIAQLGRTETGPLPFPYEYPV